jgi:hypothetical protein
MKSSHFLLILIVFVVLSVVPLIIWSGRGVIFMYVAIMIVFQALFEAFKERAESNFIRFPLYDHVNKKMLVIALALIITGISQSLGKMTFRDVFSQFDLTNRYDLAIRLTWVFAWILLIRLDMINSRNKVSSSRILKLCLKSSWILFPFVFLSLGSNFLHIENPLYQAFRLDRLD